MATESIEHAPPKVMFIGKLRPSSHQFPSCNRCNNGMSQLDQVAALASFTMGSLRNQSISEEILMKIFRGVLNNTPLAIQYMFGSSENDVFRVNGLLRLVSKVQVDERLFSQWLDPWAAKLGYALWYEHRKSILPTDAHVVVRWFTNTDIVNELYPDELLRVLSGYGTLSQGTWEESGQFFYKHGYIVENEVACFLAAIHDSCLVFIGVFKNAETSELLSSWPTFTTSAETGIVPV